MGRPGVCSVKALSESGECFLFALTARSKKRLLGSVDRLDKIDPHTALDNLNRIE